MDKARLTSASPGEDGGLLPRAVTTRAVEMSADVAISTGVGASSQAPAQQGEQGDAGDYGSTPVMPSMTGQEFAVYPQLFPALTGYPHPCSSHVG